MLDLKLMLMVWLGMFDPAVLIAIKVAVLTILADAVIGWIIALALGVFDIRKVPQFLQTNLFPYVAVLLVLAAMTLVDDGYKVLFFAVTALITVKFGTEALKDKLFNYFKPVQATTPQQAKPTRTG
jgi:urea transporter